MEHAFHTRYEKHYKKLDMVEQIALCETDLIERSNAQQNALRTNTELHRKNMHRIQPTERYK